ncbi:TniB family NTP-binding protein [Neobacillus drentensis]|uniref:TniB family NTP-binding protein n=1 Tax=Neobacillus drentensis TaxID=220684 RepID=UPI002FFDDC36
MKLVNSELTDLTLEEKIYKIKTLHVNHPRFKNAFKLIEQCHRSLEHTSDPQCMLVTGPSGAGKTTLFKSYVKTYDKVMYESTRTKKTLLWGEVPSPVRIATFLEMMLEMLGDPFPTRGTIGNKNHRLVKLIKDCKVELIMLDEFQHFVSRERYKINYEVADCFKSLINRTQVPVVLFGLEEAEEVIESNPQLLRRFSYRCPMAPFSYNTPQGVNEFRTLLGQIDKNLPFKEHSNLADADIADRIMYATNGVMNSVMKIIRDAALRAVKDNRERIEKVDLAIVYNLHASIMKGKNDNPFTKEKFEFL